MKPPVLTDGELVKHACDQLLEPIVLARYSVKVFLAGVAVGAIVVGVAAALFILWRC